MTQTPQPLPSIRIDPSERLLAIGRTGSGKTEWMKMFLEVVNRSYPLVILDPKALWLGKRPEFEKKGPGTIWKPRLMQAFDRKIADKGGVQLFQWDNDAQPAEIDQLCNDLLEYARKTREIFLDVDECEGIATATKTPRGIKKVWKMGRALGLGAWIGNQRSLGIPEIFKSQAESFTVFDLPGDRDREDAAAYTHTPEIEDMELPDYQYWYFHRKLMKQAVLMPPLDLTKRVQKGKAS